MISFRIVASFLGSFVLLGCSPAPQEPSAAEQPLVIQPDEVARNDLGTVEDLMTERVMPNVDQLWRAVSYVVTEAGTTETAPETDEDWSMLRDAANALIAAGDELTNTNREILTSEFDQSTASYQFTPDEVKQLLAENPQPWRNYIEQMQESTRLTLQAIELRDLMGLVEFGAQINEACEGCHAAYWYRPQGMPAPQ